LGILTARSSISCWGLAVVAVTTTQHKPATAAAPQVNSRKGLLLSRPEHIPLLFRQEALALLAARGIFRAAMAGPRRLQGNLLPEELAVPHILQMDVMG